MRPRFSTTNTRSSPVGAVDVRRLVELTDLDEPRSRIGRKLRRVVTPAREPGRDEDGDQREGDEDESHALAA